LKTLNQIIQKIQANASAHAQIKYVGFGDEWEIDTQQLRYPLFWSNIQNSTINGKTLNLSFVFLVFDIVQNGEQDEQEVLSDTLSIMNDLIAELQNVQEIELDESINLQPFTENFGDKVSGWRADVSVSIYNEFNKCVIPKIN